MPIEYNVIPNALTIPPSYTARPNPKTILDYDLLARAINESNPTIPIQTAKSVLEAFRAEVILQLAEGNTINLAGFVSFVVSMPIRLEQPTDLLPTDPIDVKAKPSIVLKTEVKQIANYSRLAFVEKQPTIILSYDANTTIANWIRDGFGQRIDGSNIGFDQSDEEQGVFLLSSAGNDIKQTNISLNDPSKIIINPAIDAVDGPAGTNSVEQILSIKSKYTANGQIRTGTYAKPLRTTNVVTDGAIQIFVTGQNALGPLNISGFTGAQVIAKFTALIEPSGLMRLGVGNIEEDAVEMLHIEGNGIYVLQSPFDQDVTVTITNFNELISTITSYGRFMIEICDLSPLLP